MREIRTSGSEGGEPVKSRLSSPYQQIIKLVGSSLASDSPVILVPFVADPESCRTAGLILLIKHHLLIQ